MRTFPTSEPVSVTLELMVAKLRVFASDRSDTVVDIRPSNESKEGDIKAAERTQIEYADGRLLIKTTKQRSFFGRMESIDVTIKLPAGSQIHGEVAFGEIHAEGQLGACTFKISSGDVHIAQTGNLKLDTSHGNVTLHRVEGHADITTGMGSVRILEIDGTATIKNSNGNTEIGKVSGDLRLNAANGHITIDRAGNSLTAKTAYGNVRVNEVARGEVRLESAYGELEVGIGQGTAAWIDASTQYGTVRNSMSADDGPRESDETVTVAAYTAYGDIIVRRSTRSTTHIES